MNVVLKCCLGGQGDIYNIGHYKLSLAFKCKSCLSDAHRVIKVQHYAKGINCEVS